MNKNLSYDISLITNSNIKNCIRVTLHIVVNGEYTKEDLYEIAKREIKNYTLKNKVNALTIGFYESDNSVGNGNNGFEMGKVDYVPNGEFSDAIKIKAGNYSNFKIVNSIRDKLKLPIGQKIEKGISDINKIKLDFESVRCNDDVNVFMNNEILEVIIKTSFNNCMLPCDYIVEKYTDNALNNIKNDIKKIDIKVLDKEKQDSSYLFRTILNVSDMSFDNGRYYKREFISDGKVL